MFRLTPEQAAKLAAWKKTLPPEPPTAIGGAFTYCLTPTSLGDILKVQYYDGNEIDLTEYGDW
jgi:hypothetical protein